MTIAHALTMTLGTEWNEQVPYSDPANSEGAMERAQDRYRITLTALASATCATNPLQCSKAEQA